ncbi:MAG: YrzE family protein [Desulfobacterales bacterium]|nr:MAG: YrzE family protein [Desulfobacterales bacterium]
MAMEYSVKVIEELEKAFRAAALHRPMHVDRYEAGTELVYDVTGVAQTNKGRLRLVVEKFVGGGFAGQVYRVKILDIDPQSGPIGELEVGKVFAMKILIPPTGFSRLFRNAVYWVGFQGPFQLQVNPAASRAGALWQKFIRRGAKIRFSSENAVTDIYATFVDGKLGSCGELSEWVDGRVWRLEVDDHMDLLKRWIRGDEVDAENLGSPEYRAKREFMRKFVELLHDMGGHEFARQYEWWTCKSQPNCLKRHDTEASTSGGLVAVDFRAGLALLAFLPMSPGDFKLILSGLMRGSLVQFDRGDVGKLEQFVEAHSDQFSDMRQMLEEVKTAERVYRSSVPDITYHHIHVLFGVRLWSTIIDSAVTGWKVRNLIDERCQEKLLGSRALRLLFFVLGLFPLLGCLLRKVWGRPDWRKHYWGLLTSWSYFRRAVGAKVTEKVIAWHRSGRLDGEHALRVARHVWPIWYHFPLSILPVVFHRFVTDWEYAKERMVYLAVRPVRLYFNVELREQWLREMVTEGKQKQILTNEDAEIILSQIKEPFIQKYLKCLAVHVCTLPVTQIVSVLVAIVYVAMHPEMSRGQAWGIGLGIVALFQVTPISPGSLVRGFYVLYLVIKERNFEDYNIAVFLSFFKYIGYLSFPIQMGYRYPALARFMAAHWATEAVHVVPVFGERGALLEHGVFALFYNWPLTIRRRMLKRNRVRADMPPRYWHIAFCAIIGLGIFGFADFLYLKKFGELPGLDEIWGLAVLVPLLCGVAVTLGAGGAGLQKRIIGGAICGVVVGALYTGVSAILGHAGPIGFGEMAVRGAWRVLILTIFSIIGVILTELTLREPS